MKKTKLIVAALVAVLFASCEKHYACDCTVTVNSTGQSYKKMHYSAGTKKGEAQAVCDQEAGNDGMFSVTCELARQK